ncbi:MAG: hypothetical protein CL678_15665 [Bdellovibrionaceae bacterium]|nr:hypothetical protein [Pseudobdellovibrionaceae bacterium]|tara:strand:- start:387 stop:1301 length:915 start_codon:yes stop_codon:yes gene_type:complete
MPPAIGVTRWIKQCVLRGVDFKRVGCKGQGKAAEGLRRGRVVDGMFKQWCNTGKIPEGKAWARKRMAYIAAALQQRNIRMRSANVFVKHEGIKTHLDGLGVRSNKLCVIELKTTQASLANHLAAYDVACNNKPTIKIGSDVVPNCERMHHQLQLAFGVIAAKAATGAVVVSASDGAAVYALQPGIPPHIFKHDARASAGKAPKATNTRKKQPKPKRLPKWPGALVAAKGWTDVRVLQSGVAVLTRDNSIAVAAAGKGASARPPKRALADAAQEVGATVQLFAVPLSKAWRCYRIRQKYIGQRKD